VTNPTPREVTQLLAEWSNGNESALGELIPPGERELPRLVLKVQLNTLLNDSREANAWLPAHLTKEAQPEG